MSNVKAPATLATLAMSAAIKAVKNEDSAVYDAIVSVALVLANQQIDRVEAGDDIDENKGKATWRAFLKQYAYRGGLVWRGTEHMVDAIVAAKGDKRTAAASDYIDKKDKGARLVDGLARIRTYSFKLMADVLVNHAGIIRDIAGLRASGADATAQMNRFRTYIAAHYGETGAALTGALATPAKKSDIDPIDSMIAKAEKMTETDLRALVSRINALWLERQAAASEVAEAFGDMPADADADETTESGDVAAAA